VDLAYLKRRGLLAPGRSTTLTWSWLGERVASISVATLPDGVRLSYVSAGERKIEVVPFMTSATAFNGTRRWFACPSCRCRCRSAPNPDHIGTHAAPSLPALRFAARLQPWRCVATT